MEKAGSPEKLVPNYYTKRHNIAKVQGSMDSPEI
jgi:hypothetical protein